MKTVNSLSSGKTSSYMAVHFPADIEIFSLVCNEKQACQEKDPKVRQYINDKLERYIPYFGEVVGVQENPEAPRVMMELEQLLGREIVWVRDISFDELIRQKKYLPNAMARFCTSDLKMRPIFRHLQYFESLDKVDMRIGYRWGEENRAARATTSFKDTYKYDLQTGLYRWQEKEWRQNSFPLIEKKIAHFAIKEYWQGKGIDFPADSNCPHCFWKPEQQLRKNFEDYPSQMEWANDKEKQIGATFKKKWPMQNIKRLGIQSDFNFGTGSGCQAGFCTD